MKYIARVGKEWQHKTSGRRHGKELEIKPGDSIDNYTMIKVEQEKNRFDNHIFERTGDKTNG